jgi:hypothetical protein
VNQNKYTHISFSLLNQTVELQMGNVSLPQRKRSNEIPIDRRLTWAKHIKAKRNSSTYE